MYFGYWIAGSKFEALVQQSDAMSAAIETPTFGFWESFGKMFRTKTWRWMLPLLKQPWRDGRPLDVPLFHGAGDRRGLCHHFLG